MKKRIFIYDKLANRGVEMIYPRGISYDEKQSVEAIDMSLELTEGCDHGFAIVPFEEKLHIVFLTRIWADSNHREMLKGRDPRTYTHIVSIEVSLEEAKPECIAGVLNFKDYACYGRDVQTNLIYDVDEMLSECDFPVLDQENLAFFLNLVGEKEMSMIYACTENFGTCLSTVYGLMPAAAAVSYCFLYNCMHSTLEKSGKYKIISNITGESLIGSRNYFPTSVFVKLCSDPQFRFSLRNLADESNLTPEFYNDYSEAMAYEKGLTKDLKTAEQALLALLKRKQLTSAMKNGRCFSSLIADRKKAQDAAAEHARSEQRKAEEKAMTEKRLSELETAHQHDRQEIEMLKNQILQLTEEKSRININYARALASIEQKLNDLSFGVKDASSNTIEPKSEAPLSDTDDREEMFEIPVSERNEEMYQTMNDDCSLMVTVENPVKKGIGQRIKTILREFWTED